MMYYFLANTAIIEYIRRILYGVYLIIQQTNLIFAAYNTSFESSNNVFTSKQRLAKL